ncbi:uncharacterized protein LOC133711640 [Rosa rugosa]|uniref:uncharacterized protein LOC133711640 n=1 Tax=Rosa rugosa TaxID=74645 RepID=UPI002B4017FD|nr:uncharacterized protein LOC133711640 [Rosa rugosa]
MADPTRPEFDILDSEGLEYHRWVSDMETAFVAKDYTATITDPKDDELSNKVKANALMFLRRHIDPSLRWEYLQLKTPKELWDALKGRFGNIHDTLLPELAVQWNGIRLLDYKRVNDFNKDMLRLQARLNFCGREITEDDMIYKTLSTFPTSALILADQYRLEYDNKRITTFKKLISLLQVAERQNEDLLHNNARPTGTKKIPDAGLEMVKGDRSVLVVLGEPRFGSKANICTGGDGPCSESCDVNCCNSNCQAKYPGLDGHGTCEGDGPYRTCQCTYNCVVHG